MTDNHFLSRPDAARYLSEHGVPIKPETLARWASTGRYRLPYYKLGRIVSYKVADLDALIERSRITLYDPT